MLILPIYFILLLPATSKTASASTLQNGTILVALDDDTRIYRNISGVQVFAFYLSRGNHLIYDTSVFERTRILINGSLFYIFNTQNNLADRTRFSLADSPPALTRITVLSGATIREQPTVSARELAFSPNINVQVYAIGFVIASPENLGIEKEDLPIWYYINTDTISGYVNQRFIDGFQRSPDNYPPNTLFPSVPGNISQILLILAICLPALVIVFLIFRPSKKYQQNHKKPPKKRRPYYDDYYFEDEDDDIYY
ncbi:MAG: hypothetical protein FWB72_02530 [Firmicutes bacterium]|nr:hypothetical protein [Bacillota bacterium]